MENEKEIKEKENKPKTKEEQKKEVAKAYGVDLKDIEHVKLDTGIEVFKLFNPADRSVKLISVYDSNGNANEMFKDSQKGLSFANSSDERGNAKNIFEYNMKYVNNELPLVTITEFKSNRYKYMRQIRGLKTVIRCKVKALIKGAQKGNLDLKYINFENGIGIDSNGVLIDVAYNYANNNAVIKQGNVLNASDKSFDINTDVDSISLSEEDLGNIFDYINVNEDGVSLISDKQLNIKGENISTKMLVEMYNMPELTSKLDLTPAQKDIYAHLTSFINKKSGSQNKQSSNTKQKQFTKTNNHNINADDNKQN